jgi:hypothetical protein
VFLALVHYPIYNKNNEVIATSITNLDIHDISRCAATYDLQQYYLVHPHPAQHALADELLHYWTRGAGAQYNPDRCQALSKIRLAESLEAAEAEILKTWGGNLCRVVTDAHPHEHSTTYHDLRRRMAEPNAAEETTVNYLLIFGTGYGLAREIIDSADVILEPVIGRGDYNHLSVRSAASIIMDRLLGPPWFDDRQQAEQKD